jgi:hypothetical protein
MRGRIIPVPRFQFFVMVVRSRLGGRPDSADEAVQYFPQFGTIACHGFIPRKSLGGSVDIHHKVHGFLPSNQVSIRLPHKEPLLETIMPGLNKKRCDE